MRPTADIFLALRYLRPKRTFISVITLLSVMGPVLGVALLIVVTSVMSGFDRDIRDRILDMQAHLQVYPGYLAGPDRVIPRAAPVVEGLEGVGATAAPLIEGPILIQIRHQVTAKYVRGIDPEAERRVTSVHESSAFRGRYDIDEGEALIGADLAAELGVDIGNQILIHSPKRLTESVQWSEDGEVTISEPDELYLPEEVTVVGVFSMGVYEFDSSVIFVHIDQAADLFGLDWGSATSVHARVPDPFQMTALTEAARNRLPDYRVVTWQEANEMLFGALRVEKNLMFFLLTFIVIVASFGIAGTLITVAVQKTREIGILKAVGMSRFLVARVFLLQGAVIGAIGTTLGTILGLTIIRFRNAIAGALGAIMGVEVFPKKLYHLSEIPALATAPDVVRIVVLALVICVCAALVPALYASALSPAQALQEEN